MATGFTAFVLCPLLRENTPLGWDEVAATVDSMFPSGFYLLYYGFFRPTSRKMYLGDDCGWRVELIDTWKMTIENLGVYKGYFTVSMPGREYMALRLTKAEAGK